MNEVRPEIVERLVQFVDRLSGFHAIGGDITVSEKPGVPAFNVSEEARAIFSEIAPADPDRAEAIAIIEEWGGSTRLSMVMQAIRRGRSLGSPSVRDSYERDVGDQIAGAPKVSRGSYFSRYNV